MSSDPRLTTVRESVRVDASPEEAFTFFTARMGEWWPLELASYGGPRAKDIFWSHASADVSTSGSSTETSFKWDP
jgi:hypothetical protein